MGISDEALAKLILDDGVLTKEEVDGASIYSREKGCSLYDALLEKNLLSDENIGKISADYFGLQPVFLKNVSISEDTLKIIPEQTAKTQYALTFFENEKEIHIATANPTNTLFISLVAKKAGKTAIVKYATPRDIENTFPLYKKHLQTAFETLLKNEVEKAGKTTENEAPITKIVDTLIEYAYDNKASDIHIEPKKSESIIRFRIDGMLHDVLKLPKPLHDQVISRIKVNARLRTDEHLSAQDGKMIVEVPNEDIDIRVSIIPIVHGEDCVMRLLTSRNRSFNLSDLGMNDHDRERVESGFHKPYGMVLSTGPTGSGKTTSMYAIVRMLNIRDRNIATIEDPVEYDIEGISQIQVNPKTNLTFAEGLRSILRQDPDIIFVGEIRDRETVGIAVNSALTGHLVLSTLHTNDAASSLLRMIDMDVEPYLIASSVNTVIAQRLVRTICEKCKVSTEKSLTELKKLFPSDMIRTYLKTKKSARVYYGKGCKVCHSTGYLGRIGVFEILEMSEKVKDLIVHKADSETIMKQARDEGMTTMMEDGLDKILRGVTTIDEVLRVTRG